MTQVAEIKSPHEQRLEDNIAGKEDIYRESHKRVFKLLERFDGQKPAIDVERALYFTQSMAETVGQPLVLRWAKALMNVAKNITVMVQDDQLLLGRCGGHDGRYGILYPELDGDFLDIAVRDLPTRPQSPASISPSRRSPQADLRRSRRPDLPLHRQRNLLFPLLHPVGA